MSASYRVTLVCLSLSLSLTQTFFKYLVTLDCWSYFKQLSLRKADGMSLYIGRVSQLADYDLRWMGCQVAVMLVKFWIPGWGELGPIAVFPTPVPLVYPDTTFFFFKNIRVCLTTTLGSILGSSGCSVCMGMRSEGWRERASFALSRSQNYTPPPTSYEPIFALLPIIYLWGTSKALLHTWTWGKLSSKNTIRVINEKICII